MARLAAPALLLALFLPVMPAPAQTEGREVVPILPRASERTEDDASLRQREAIVVNPLTDELVSVALQARGDSRELALVSARQRAVLATAGRVLIEGRLIRASGLMERYLERNAARFVTGIEAIRERFSGGQTVIDCRVFIDYNALRADLEEKRFLYRPAFKPTFAVFLDETLDGQPLGQEVGRILLQNEMEKALIKSYGGEIDNPTTRIDVVAADRLSDAIVAAERRNVELIVTGTVRTRSMNEIQNRRVYFDNFSFYETEMNLRVLRVDTGEELFTVEARNSAAAREQAEAIRLAIERTSATIASSIQEQYRTFWANVVQGGADFEVLLTGTDDELIRVVMLHLERLGPRTGIHVKRQFNRSAVLSVITTATRAELLELLKSCPYPSLTVVRDNGKTFEVQVSG
jgi:hypothetical protein